MSDVTYADQPAIEALLFATSPSHPARDFLQRLMDIAKADAPALPDNAWVLAEVNADTFRVLKHNDGFLFVHENCRTGLSWPVDDFVSVTSLEDAIKAEHRQEWLNYFNTWTGAVGWAKMTPELMIRAMQAKTPPFGVCERGGADYASHPGM